MPDFGRFSGLRENLARGLLRKNRMARGGHLDVQEKEKAHMIKVEHLVKKFGLRTAVDDVSFEVGTGTVLGVLGPNGAGKTTTIRMIAGYLPPTAGTVTVNSFGEGDISTPFGGYRQSGFGGRDNSIHAHDQYTQLKTIWLDLSDNSDTALD